MDSELLQELTDLLSSQIKRTDKAIEGYVNTLLLLLQRVIRRELRDLPSDKRDRNFTNREILRFLGGLESLIDTEEIDNQIASIDELLLLQMDMANEAYRLANNDRSAPQGSSRDVKANIAVFLNSREQNVRILAKAYANEVRQKLVDSIITGQPLSEFDLLEVPAARIVSTLKDDIKTSSATLNRMVQVDNLQRTNKNFVLYAGPKDARNRPFCAQRVNKIFPMDIVYTWDNGQGLPAYLYCGGYGCRHVLIPVKV